MMPTESNYKINLEMFEGPLDLLLYLIRKNDLNIYDIPVVIILDQYNAYLEVMNELDVDVAGEFILMAAELTHIKSRLLVNTRDTEENEEPDPRADLVARLLEYEKYKRAALWLSHRPQLGREVFVRPEVVEEVPEPEDIELVGVEPFKLLQAFHEILKKVPKLAAHEVETDRVSVTERIYQILDIFKVAEGDNILFESIFAESRTRRDLILNFLAILEMARLKMLAIYQMDLFGPIRLRRTLDMSEAVDAGLLVAVDAPASKPLN